MQATDHWSLFESLNICTLTRHWTLMFSSTSVVIPPLPQCWQHSIVKGRIGSELKQTVQHYHGCAQCLQIRNRSAKYPNVTFQIPIFYFLFYFISFYFILFYFIWFWFRFWFIILFYFIPVCQKKRYDIGYEHHQQFTNTNRTQQMCP